ncbi:long-chain fatty acid--CoA ligase [Geothermobacter hydrogeniphilus]|uniref:Long-chain fatty acid--CoA ligase n=1 Tax=Geothermobacter hydrogeniphilus TaxID=1969733 RepID=A0A2K2H652_9BACT|nr:fatty acid--CoA ligase [Geothermobacter hydrogeniphilus]PNU18720.1 long-chain fatty acid--CoA ligase [Geothermobacter hydrogeniphilus]
MSTLIERTASAYTYPLLIKNLFNAPVVDNPEQEIVYRELRRHDYRAFRQRVCQLAGTLRRLGVKAGDTVAVMDYDSHRYLECFFAVPMLGAVLHTVNVRLSPEQILYTIDHAEDDLLLIHADFLPILEAIKGRIDTVKNYILLQDEDSAPASTVAFAGEYETLLEESPATFDFPEFDENTRATTFYTTGTTGMPKGVYFSHRQLVLHTLGVLAALGTPTRQGRFHQGDVYMPITPMFHVHAWGFPYVATALGIKQVYPGRYAPDTLLELIKDEGVTLSHCVPTILHMLLSHPKIDTIDLRGWKVLIGGAALPQAMCRAALDRGIDIFAGYGMSETCPVLTVAHIGEEDLSADDEVEIRCKTGRPMPLVDLRVVDEELRDVPADDEAVGEIVVRAPWLTQGYLKDHRNSETLWRGGYLHTGDVASMDRKRYVKITDRIKDVIKVGGEWLSSLEVEDILGQHPAVAEVAVIGIVDDKWGERPLALVVPKGDAAPDEKSLVGLVREFIDKGMMSKQALLLKVRLVEEINKTSVGKINKRVLREKYGQ